MKEETTPLTPLPRRRVRGEVVRIRFANPATGFAVVVLKTPGGHKHTLQGPLASLQPGEFIEAEGELTNYKELGPQLKVESYRATLPATADGIAKYLTAAIPGVGPKTAAAIVEHFGDDTLRIISETPRRLLEIPGFGQKRLADLRKTWQNSAAQREQLIFLQGLGITPAYCSRLFKRYGDRAAEEVQKHPYRLADEVNGIGFLKADSIARGLGIAENDPARLAAAAAFAMHRLVDDGNVCVPEDLLRKTAAELTRISGADAAAGIAKAVEEHLLVKEHDMFYPPNLADLENFLPQVVHDLACVPDFAGRRLAALPAELTLAPEQAQALDFAARFPLSIITGGPGVGKTTVTRELVRRAEKAKLKIALAAPTGRAAKRLAEATGLPAKTLHRLLGFDPATGKFAYNIDRHLPADLLVVDESSMLDLPLAAACLSAVRPGASVVLVGDVDQLPSVGPGRVLADCIASGFFAVTRLRRIFRQAENSAIIVNAHRVNAGKLPEPPSGRGLSDFYWIEQEDPVAVPERISRLVAERIPARFHLDPFEEIQVLTPMNRGSCGAASLNERLAACLNPAPAPELSIGERKFKVGDKVMQIANNYDKLVFNGDLGRLKWIASDCRRFAVVFDNGERTVEYEADELRELAPAYAITIHKSQGSEFPAVVVPLLTQHYLMLRRNLLYTAMTRAKKLLVLVGSRRAVEMAVNNARVEPRFSLLGSKLRALRRQS